MQSLSKAMAGDACTVKWMFGVPELLRYLRANHIEEVSAAKPSIRKKAAATIRPAPPIA